MANIKSEIIIKDDDNYGSGKIMLTRTRWTDFENIINQEIWRSVIDKTAQEITNYILEKHLPEIMEKISVDALANMTIAHAGAKINETLNKKMPDVIKEIHHHHMEEKVYQKGFFGGIERIK